ncbi:DarT ssDNA thymidine ADP-ribosyltransferase family protein [Macrococcoides caseolyticum]|uniref:DarT ssDNA thymidine ADP-ribosyltransferase family protein n=1 Tax=Macrococcoides caseolyticum TaxID=69966 RepID=UPI000C32DAE4|nr:DarT ssDNA thymidine ADP-ribosyltransferase family protein [Macrococcus caseolyticus]PKE62175.1 hypothetical protein CW683_11755 [Macrococcus caseolyticus]PKF44353.1 hypothetical protein CW664_11320 [Macrococcus caseolyticus]
MDKLLSNISKAYEQLQTTDVAKSWYEVEDVTGIAWHFTDIKNMARILRHGALYSQKIAKEKDLMKNDNASQKVNHTHTLEEIHDYVRFYLRPKTPTQYRNEGIFKTLKKNEKGCRRLYDSKGEFWEKDLAHLPVPIFIGFDLKQVIKKGGSLSKQSFAGFNGEINENIDIDGTTFLENVTTIYGNYTDKKIKHTEVIVLDAFNFEPKDLLKIVVRSEAEKLSLLTYISNEFNNQVVTKDERDKLDINKYFDKIIVDPNFYYKDVGYLDFDGEDVIINGIERDDYEIKSQTFEYSKRSKTIVHELEQLTFSLLDVKNDQVEIAKINNPSWIIYVDYWENKKIDNPIRRYYSNVIVDGKFYSLFRNVNENDWFNKITKKEFNGLSQEQSIVLRSIEESLERDKI